MSEKTLFFNHINTSWTLFLDRDGVINQRIYDGYVRSIEEFVLIAGVKEALGIFRSVFGRIIVVTNQQGIGKGLMTESDLKSIHDYMLKELNYTIDRIYYAPYLVADNHPFRKPNIGMAEAAQKDFSDIDFQKSIMVGDSSSDMAFGRKAGMKTVFVGNEETHTQPDMYVNSLYEFACMLKNR
ncbi:MAG: HAD family hydrolase [Bacteroidales bacterium]|jgi:histidinol-phosphate phosphatase family protein|nr:HAD family hydrolase [Fibrobacter sp.]NLJ81831.1 HAD family hydrolase [Bacteroidales bacterium]